MKKSFIILSVLTVLALLLVMLIPGYPSRQDSSVNELLLPGVAAQINDVNRVEIVAPGNNVVATMSRTEYGWQLQQMGGYRADWSKLQPVLAALAQARVVALKTDKPEYYARLGVEDIDAAGAGSLLLRISIDEVTTGLLIGHQTQGRQGQYIRRHGQSASAEIDRRLDVSTELLDWLDKEIIDIEATEVAEVEIIHPQGKRLLVMKISADQTDFEVADLSADRELTNSWAVNSLGSVLSMLQLETVQPTGGTDWAGAVKMRLLTFSGVEIIVELSEFNDRHLLRLHASHPAAEVVGHEEIEIRAAVEVAARVAEINQKTEGWVYGISEQNYLAMSKTPENVLKPLETP